MSKKNKWRDVSFSEFFEYDGDSPSGLRWRVDRFGGRGYATKTVSAGDVAGSVTTKGYWEVMLNRVAYTCHRIVWELHNGALRCGFVIDHKDGNGRNNTLENLRAIPEKLNARNQKRQRNNKSGITGVRLHYAKGRGGVEYPFWEAGWSDLNGSYHRKSFSVTKYGNEEALRLACEYRARMIEQLNEQGAGYTERHGKENQ